MNSSEEKYLVSKELKNINEREIAILDQDSTDGESWDYYCNGQITNATVNRNRISGIIRELAEEFHVEISVSENEISSSCSCGYKEGVCKHVVALLYSWANDREDFVNIGSLVKNLHSLEKQELINIIELIFENNPANVKFINKSDNEIDDYENDIYADF